MIRTLQRKQRRKALQRLCFASLLLLAITYFTANMCARLVLERHLSATLKCNVRVASVQIGWPYVRIYGIRLAAVNAPNEPFVNVPDVRVSLTPGDGFQHGVWADEVVVTEPILTLNISESGELLTQLPEPPPGGDGPLPLLLLKIVGATVDVKQPDGKTFRVGHVTAVARLGERLRVSAVVPKLFGGKIRFNGDVDPKSLAGDVRISAKGLTMSSAELQAMPVFSNCVSLNTSDTGAKNRFAACGDVALWMTVPPNPGSLLDCAAEAELAVDFVDLPGRGVRADNVIVHVSHKAGSPTNIVGDAGVFGGRVHLDGELRLTEAVRDINQPIRGHLSCSVDRVPLESIAGYWNLPGQMTGEVSVQGSLSASMFQDHIRMDGALTSNVTKLSVFGVQSAPLIVKAAAGGDANIVDRRFHPGSGNIVASAASNGTEMADIVSGLLQVLQSSAIQPKRQSLIHRLQSSESRGRVSFSAELNAPLQAVKDVRLVNASGRIVGKNVAMGGFVTSQMGVSLNVQDGIARLEFPETQVLDQVARHTTGLSGQCTFPFAPAGVATAEFGIANLSFASAARVADRPPQSYTGTVSTSMTAAVPVNRLSDSTAWQGHGVVTSPVVLAHGEPITDCRLQWTLSDNQVRISQVSAKWHQTSLSAQATVEIIPPFRFAGNAAVGAVDLRKISQLAASRMGTTSQATGSAAFDGSIHGDAASMNFTCGGDLTLQNFFVAGRRLGDHRLHCSLSPTVLHIEEKEARFFGGDATLTATLRRSATPIRHIAAQFHNVQLASIRDILAIDEIVSGAIDADLEIIEPMLREQLSGRFSLRSRDAYLAGIPVETFQTSVVAQAGTIIAGLHARAVGANCQATAQANISNLMTTSPEILSDPQRLPVFGQLELTDVSIERLRRVLTAMPGRARIPPELSGLLELRLKRDSDAVAAGLLLTGNATIRNLQWNQVLWSKEVVARLQVMPGALEVKEVVGTFADGRISGRGIATFAGSLDGQFRLSVSRMNISKAAIPVRELTGKVTGVADLQVEGRLGRRISGRASLSVDRACVCGVCFSQARFPMDWSVVPFTQDIQINSKSIAMNLGGGRIHGQAAARWNGRLDLNASATAQHVDTRKLMANGSGTGGGTLDGSVHLSAHGARSINDVSGRFQGSLKDAQAMKMPVLDQASRLLNSLSRSTSFETGTLKGRLANGVVTLEQLNLMASNVRIVMDGTATLRGNLNLFVSAYTSRMGPADRILDFANSPIMLAAPAPIAVVAKINDALKDRTVHVNVGGTVGQPLVRLQPGRQLQQKALQFLVNSSLSFAHIKPIQTVGHTR